MESAKRLKERCEAYFRACDENGRRYTRPGLAVFLDLTPAELTRVEGGTFGENRAAVIQKAMARMSDALQQRTDSVAAALLRQKVYSPEDSGAGNRLEILVRMDEQEYGA